MHSLRGQRACPWQQETSKPCTGWYLTLNSCWWREADFFTSQAEIQMSVYHTRSGLVVLGSRQISSFSLEGQDLIENGRTMFSSESFFPQRRCPSREFHQSLNAKYLCSGCKTTSLLANPPNTINLSFNFVETGPLSSHRNCGTVRSWHMDNVCDDEAPPMVFWTSTETYRSQKTLTAVPRQNLHLIKQVWK